MSYFANCGARIRILALVGFAWMHLECAPRYRIDERHIQNALITESYGILSDDDIAVYAWITGRDDAKKKIGDLHWQCLDTKYLKFGCRDMGYDEDEKIRHSVFKLEYIGPDQTELFHERRAIDIRACREMVAEWRRLSAGETKACVGGEYFKEIRTKSGRRKRLWAYDRFKTKKGCQSYFAGGCNLDHWRSQGYPDSPYGAFRPEEAP